MWCHVKCLYYLILKFGGVEGGKNTEKISSFSVRCQKIPKKSELATLNIRRNDFNPNLKSILVFDFKNNKAMLHNNLLLKRKGLESFLRLVDCNFLIRIFILFVFL